MNNSAKSSRFYSSALNDSTDSTPPQVYGWEQREPSIIEKPRSRPLRRMSYALVDIKEDFFSGQLNPRATAEKLKRRTSLFIQDGPPASTPDLSRSSTQRLPRRMSILSLDTWSSPPQRLGRRLSSLTSFSRRKGPKSREASISQPNLLGSSTEL